VNRATHVTKRFRISWLLVLPVFLYLGVTLFWQSRGFYQITGDEPHYLVITDSLVRDHDLYVLNNYSADTPVHRAFKSNLGAPEHVVPHIYKQFSNHYPGLSFLLVLPYRIAGVVGAKIFMALLAGLWPLLIYRLLFQVTGSENWSVLTALCLSIGLPFLPAANQIYPDLLCGTIVFWGATKIFEVVNEKDEQPASRIKSVWMGVVIGFLPWLHSRFMLPAAIMAGAYLYFVMRISRPSLMRALKYFVPPLGVIVGLLWIHNGKVFGSIAGYYNQSLVHFSLRTATMIFIGLHWDQNQGIFFQQPLFLLGLMGLVFLVKANWRFAATLAILYLAIILPTTVHPAWYGGLSFSGRFWWAVAGLWVFPVACAVKFLIARSKLVLPLLAVASITLQYWYALKWLFRDNFLIVGLRPMWVSRTYFIYGPVWKYLPTFQDFSAYLKHPANFVFVAFGLLLVISGWLWSRGNNRALLQTWFAFLTVAISLMILLPPATGSFRLLARELPGQIGAVEGHNRVASEKDGAGIMMFGSYIPLKSGSYEAMLEYETNTAGNFAANFDIVYDLAAKMAAHVNMPRSDVNSGILKQQFSVNGAQSLNSRFEFRVTYWGRGSVKLKRLTITPISFQD
jgi:hypothetical protein